jgi:hypothetical protein
LYGDKDRPAALPEEDGQLPVLGVGKPNVVAQVLESTFGYRSKKRHQKLQRQRQRKRGGTITSL